MASFMISLIHWNFSSNFNDICNHSNIHLENMLYIGVRWESFLRRPVLASLIAPQRSKIKSSVKPKASRSELSIAVTKS